MTTPEYRAGVVDGRLDAIERHQSDVNGSIERTGQALLTLTVAVSELTTQVKLLDGMAVMSRLNALEQNDHAEEKVEWFKRWMLTVAVSVLVIITSLRDLVHLHVHF